MCTLATSSNIRLFTGTMLHLKGKAPAWVGATRGWRTLASLLSRIVAERLWTGEAELRDRQC